MAAGPVAACLSDDTIVAFVGGSIGAEARASVEGHIVHCEACRGLLGDAAAGALVQTGGASSESSGTPMDELPTSPLPRAGDLIADKYLVEGLLGTGSMGWVLGARHRALGHRVAIKVPRPTGPEAARRFLAEAKTCARLSHPHIPRVFDMGRLPGGAPFMVMEYLVGKDLAEMLAAGPVALPDAVRWIVEACDALATAHAAGIVHRDLKPSNLFLATGPTGDAVVKVLDFGISKLAPRAISESNDGATATGAIIGSPLYMSPEQIRADKSVDARSDIWSLGVILYQLTTGQPPFRGPGLPALSIAITVQAPRRPSALRPEVSRRLERIILRCLSKSPEGRYENVGELAAALRASSPSTDSIAERRRKPLAWAVGMAAALLAIGGAAVILRPRQQAAAIERDDVAIARRHAGTGPALLPVPSNTVLPGPPSFPEPAAEPTPDTAPPTARPSDERIPPPAPSVRRPKKRRERTDNGAAARGASPAGPPSRGRATPPAAVGPLDTPY